jgi:hypothetical protein
MSNYTTIEDLQRLITHKQQADRLQICTKTLDNWIAEGRLPEPIRINRRKFHIAGVEPRADA